MPDQPVHSAYADPLLPVEFDDLVTHAPLDSRGRGKPVLAAGAIGNVDGKVVVEAVIATVGESSFAGPVDTVRAQVLAILDAQSLPAVSPLQPGPGSDIPGGQREKVSGHRQRARI